MRICTVAKEEEGGGRLWECVTWALVEVERDSPRLKVTTSDNI